MLTLDQFDYHLPSELIAQKPMAKRDHSRLLHLDLRTQLITHHHFYDLSTLLQPGDVLVRNNTKVIPARILGTKTTGGHVEILLTKRLETSASIQIPQANLKSKFVATLPSSQETWECLTKPGLKPEQKVNFAGNDLTASCQEITGYTRKINFNKSQSELFDALHQIGHTPIPPYIQWHEDDETQLRKVYQTLYAKHAGSAAAPTAGLHFTNKVDAALKSHGIKIVELTLHVGLGTFLPVKEKDITQHQMHGEKFTLSPEAAEQLNLAKKNNQRIIAVGTTSTRVLESCVDENGLLSPQSGETELYVYPPYRFKFIDGMITNFHLPKSTLLMLVSSLASAPNTSHEFTDFISSPVGTAYQAAIKEKYRFYSFGDAMLVL